MRIRNPAGKTQDDEGSVSQSYGCRYYKNERRLTRFMKWLIPLSLTCYTGQNFLLDCLARIYSLCQ
jgi:hypothetical protein